MSQSPPPVRVLHITASSMIGGGPEHVWQLVKHLPNTITSYIAAPNCKPYGPRFADIVGKQNMVHIPQRRFTLGAFWQLIKFVKKNHIQIIHSHGKGAGIYGRLASIFTKAINVHTFHGIHMPQKTLPRAFNIFLERVLCRISKKCITVSQGEYDHAKELNIAPSKLNIILNGVQIPEEINMRLLPKPFNIIHISRFDRVKNSLFLYDIAKALQKKGLLPACKFIIIGDGEQKAELEEKITADKLSASFQLVGQQDSTKAFWTDAGCLLSTSLREGLPLAVLEAEAHGVPAIVSDVVGNRDAIVHGSTGLLYPLQDADAAAQCIIDILASEEHWQKMCVNAHTHAKKYFSVQTMGTETAKIYMQALAG